MKMSSRLRLSTRWSPRTKTSLGPMVRGVNRAGRGRAGMELEVRGPTPLTSAQRLFLDAFRGGGGGSTP